MTNLLTSLPHRQASKYGNREVFKYQDYETGKWLSASWNEFSQLVDTAALSIHRLGIGEKDNIAALREAINANCALTEEDLSKKIHADMVLPLGYITGSLINDFEKLKPFGQGNPRPLFVQKELSVISPSVVGKNRNVVRMQLSDRSGCRIPAVYFGDADAFMEYISDKKEISAVFYPAINTFRGVSSIQLTITNYR